MLLLALSGCAEHRTHSKRCVYEPIEIPDDEPTELGTAQELLAAFEGYFGAEGTWADGEITGVELEVRRASGAAVLVQAELVEEVSVNGRGVREQDYYPMVNVLCSSRLEVPVNLALRSDDGRLDVVLGAQAQSLPGAEDPERRIWANLPLGDVDLPATTQDPADWDVPRLISSLELHEGLIDNGRVAWEAQQDGEAVSETVLEFEQQAADTGH
ncbi:MAG: hypothetical protein VX899_24255 [Myxococcota bacterium]|nr:hypothetical protein [Myxococcota bacterium]